MERKPTKLKEILREGKVAFGTCIYSFSPNLVELAGYSGLDFCRIDNEHAWRQDAILEHMMRGGVIGDIVPLVRVDRDNPYLIRKVLEIGAGGVIIPNVENAEEVKKVVSAAKFPPCGIRGYGGLCFSGGYGTKAGRNWIKWSNEETLVGVMIENRQAVENIDSIMSVEDLDFVLFGPADYSISIGLPAPKKNHPEVQDAIKRTIESANKHGTYVMIGVSSPWDEEAKKYIDLGCRMIEIGHDYTVLREVWQRTLKALKGE